MPSLRNDGHYNLYSDRRYIYYGVVNLQESLEHHIVLQNMSHSEELNLEISVEVNDADNDAPRHIFHLKPLWMHHSNCASNGCQLCGQKYLTLRPGDKHSLTVIFVPQAVVQYCAKLIIRPQKVDLPNTTLVSSDVKFSVPLWGYGGIAALSFTGLKSTEQLSPFHWYIPLPTNQPLVISSSNRQHHHHHPIYELLFPSTQQSMHFTMQNCGHRAAFIKILLSHGKSSLDFRFSKYSI